MVAKKFGETRKVKNYDRKTQEKTKRLKWGGCGKKC